VTGAGVLPYIIAFHKEPAYWHLYLYWQLYVYSADRYMHNVVKAEDWYNPNEA
jgi:hypothetical protein